MFERAGTVQQGSSRPVERGNSIAGRLARTELARQPFGDWKGHHRGATFVCDGVTARSQHVEGAGKEAFGPPVLVLRNSKRRLR